MPNNEPTPTKPKASSWNRDGFFIRLTKERKTLLQSIAHDVGGDPSPICAIDRALDLASSFLAEPETATSSESGTAASAPTMGSMPLDALDAAALRIETQSRLERERLQAMHREANDRFHALSDLIASAIQSGDSSETQSFDAWLTDEVARRGLTIQKVAIAKAMWVSKTRSSVDQWEADFEVELVGADGKPQQRKVGDATRVRVSGIDAASGLGLAPMQDGIYLIGQPAPSGQWVITAYKQKPDNTLGERLDLAAKTAK